MPESSGLSCNPTGLSPTQNLPEAPPRHLHHHSCPVVHRTRSDTPAFKTSSCPPHPAPLPTRLPAWIPSLRPSLEASHSPSQSPDHRGLLSSGSTRPSGRAGIESMTVRLQNPRSSPRGLLPQSGRGTASWWRPGP